MPTVNSTHRKRLARAYAAQAGITYMAALHAVTKAQVAGRLPARLDDEGIQTALRILAAEEHLDDLVRGATAAASAPATVTTDAVGEPTRRLATDPRDQPIFDLSAEYEQITGKQGLLYITSPDGKSDRYVFGEGFVALGRKEAHVHIETLLADAKLMRGGGDRYYLINDALRLLRQVWQGRVTLERRPGRGGEKIRFAIDDQPASTINEIHLQWLHKHRYFEVNLSPGEEWAIARTTTFGDEVLARNGADRDKFADGLPENTGWVTDQPYDYQTGFDLTGTRQATVRDLLKVAEKFRAHGRVDWWWHDGPDAGRHGTKTVSPDLDQDGALVLTEDSRLPGNKHGEVTTLVLDFIDDPDQAARHLVWPGHSGVTLRDQDGSILTTYRLHIDTAEEATRKQAVRNSTPLDPDTDRLMSGPHTTKVTVRNRQAQEMPRCDVCNRKLKAREQWWLVHAPNRGWENHTGAVCADHSPANLPVFEPPAQAQQPSEEPKTSKTVWLVAHEGNPVPRCTATSWRGGSGPKADQSYGPGGYNRCVKAAGHTPKDGGNDPHHVDEWGNLFRLEPSFKVLNNIGNDEMAKVAREAGMHVTDGSDGSGRERRKPLPSQNTLWMTPDREMVKVSEVYADEQRITAQVVYPVPPRTTVRIYSYADAALWHEPTDAQVRRYERAWGFAD